MLTRIHHFVQAVRNVEEAREAYCRIFDLERPEITTDPRGFHTARVLLGTIPLLLCQSIGEPALAKFVEQKGEGIFCVSLVENAPEATLARLKAKNIRVIPGNAPSGVAYYFPHPKATHGVYYEFYPKVPEEEPRPQPGFVQRVHLVGHAVRSVKATLSMYADLFGLRPNSRGIVDRPDAGIRSAWLPIGQDSIEVFEPLGPEGPVFRFLERHGDGFYNLTMKVKGLKALLDKLQAQGVRPIPGTAYGAPKAFWLHPRDTHGVLMELHE